ncbi:MAG: hypothetical protein HY319_03385 [Armatimonadetes bacterium]|nr:hypothetical protein [Armatimonadota bacterium]
MIASVGNLSVTRALSHQAPPGAAMSRVESAEPLETFAASGADSSEKPDNSKYIITGIGLALAIGACGAAVWWTSQMPEPQVPQSSLFDVETPSREQPRNDWNRGGDWNGGRSQGTLRHQSSSPYTPPNQTTRIDSNGKITVPLGSGLSVDSDGVVGAQVGGTTFRSDGNLDFQVSPNLNLRTDGTAGVRLNENMSIRTDGTVEWHLGGRR